MGDFYGTGIEIGAGLGPIGSTEKKGLGQLWATFEGGFFMFSGAKKMLKIVFMQEPPSVDYKISDKKVNQIYIALLGLFIVLFEICQ